MSDGEPTYAVFPGPVFSDNDGELHHISYSELVRLYGVPPKECVRVSLGEPLIGVDLDDLIELYPDPTGEYDIPEDGCE